MRLILGMIHDLKMGDNQAIFVGLHFPPRDMTRGGGMVRVQRWQQKAGHWTLNSRRAEKEIYTPKQRQRERKMIDEYIHFF